MWELLKFQLSMKVWVRYWYFVWKFKGSLSNFTQDIVPIHWKMCTLFTGENLRALRFNELISVFEMPPWKHHLFRDPRAVCLLNAPKTPPPITKPNYEYGFIPNQLIKRNVLRSTISKKTKWYGYADHQKLIRPINWIGPYPLCKR